MNNINESKTNKNVPTKYANIIQKLLKEVIFDIGHSLSVSLKIFIFIETNFLYPFYISK